jgi:hypothetical protein
MGIASLGGILSGAGDVESPNLGQSTSDFRSLMDAYFGQSGNVYNNEAQYKPKYAAMDAGLFNTNFQKTFGSVLPMAASGARNAAPGASGLMNTLTSQAQDQLRTNGALDPAAQRQVQQSVRSSQASRGLGYGPGDAAQEQFYQMQTQEQRRAQNQSLAGGVAQQDWNMFGMPAFNLAAGAAGQAGSVAVGAHPTLGPDTNRMLAMPYEASLQQNIGTAQNNTGLYESMDKNSTGLVSSAMSSL